MKMRSFVSALALCFLFLTSSAQVTNQQYSIITKISADWCINCGTWAWDAFEDMQVDLADKNVIFLLAHRTGGLENEVSGPWCDNLKFQFQPEFYLNNEFNFMNGATAPEVIASMGEQIDLLANLGAFAGVQGTAFLADGSDDLMAQVDVEFFNETAGEYYLGVYIIQNNIIANQTGQGLSVQPKLLTGGFTEDWYGIPISGTTGLQTFDFSTPRPENFSIEEEGDTEILSVIWNKREDGTYTIFNANMTDEILMVSDTDNPVLIQLELTGRFRGDNLSLALNSEIAIENAKITVNNINGQSVYAKSHQLQEGETSLSLELSSLSSGIYLVSLSINGNLKTLKVLKP